MSSNIIYLNQEQFDEEVLNSKIPVVVDFYSHECPPCEVLAPIYDKMAQKYGDYLKFIKILRQDNRDLAQRFSVTSSPTVLFFKNGQEIGSRLTGFLNKPQVRKAIEEISGDVLPPTEIEKVNCDLIILGAGAAGLTAALYAARARLNTVVIDESVPGGQAATTYHVANYPGTVGVVRGKEITTNMKEQALSFGARVDDLKEIFEIKLTAKEKYVRTEDTEYIGKALIIATGAQPRPLPAEGADEFKGRGIHYCATCDGAMYENRRVVVIGGGNSAVEEANFLTRFASHVTIIHQFDHFQASKIAQEEAFNNEKIDVIWDSEVRRVNGESHSLTSVVIENIKTGKLQEVPTDGAFVYIGTQPMSTPFKHQVKTDDWGYVLASEDTKTNVEGVFAAGDIRTKQIRQIVTAAADGAVAGIMAEKYILSLK